MGLQHVKFWANGVTLNDPQRHVAGNRGQEEVGMAEESGAQTKKTGRKELVLQTLVDRKRSLMGKLAAIDKSIEILSKSEDAALVLDSLHDAGIR
jgi:hypothetical protein